MDNLIKAVVFDMDGLMFDTERLWLDAVKKTNEVYGYNVPESLIIECMGKRKDKIDETLVQSLGSDFDPQRFRELNKIFMNEEVEKNGLKKKKGLDELLAYLKRKKYKIGIASSSKAEKVKKRFEQSNLSPEFFDVIISGDMVTESKPNPDVYLLACEKLNVKPSEAIALEDSENGLLSAISAGLKTIWVPDIKIPSDLVLDKTFAKIESLDKLIDLLENF